MNSMTGYGAAEQQGNSFLIGIEIKGYNSRFLDIMLELPAQLSALEVPIRTRIIKSIARGRIEVRIYLIGAAPTAAPIFDYSNAVALKSTLDELCRVLNLSENVSLSHLLHLEETVTLVTKDDSKIYRPILFEIFEVALAQFETSRTTEGATAELDIRRQLDSIERMVYMVEKQVPKIEIHIRETFSSRYRELLDADIDPQRLQAETTLLVIKSSINEELVRLKAHTAEFYATLKRSGRIGKRLDFICQEMQRETNTIASKTALIEIGREVIEMKEALENVREQLRNVE